MSAAISSRLSHFTACTSSALKVNFRVSGALAAKAVHHLVLEELSDRRGIFGDADMRQRHAEAELLHHPPRGAVGRAFVPARMRAAGIRPQPAGMVFGVRALLQEQAIARPDEDRDRQVAGVLDMRVELANPVAAAALVKADYRLQVRRPRSRCFGEVHDRAEPAGSAARTRNHRGSGSSAQSAIAAMGLSEPA